jgi:CubicO group peptidase (beta-lactamase class C family)
MKKYFSPCILLLLLSCSSSDGDQQTQSLDARIARIENGLMPGLHIKGRDTATYNITERLEELNIPGLSVAFAANGEVEWSKAYGMADTAGDRPMETNTMLLAGSISKPVAALRAHQLVEVGSFELDESINTYLSSWQVPDNEFTKDEKVTIRRILNHTAGLTVWGFPGYDVGDSIPSVVDVLDGLGNTEPVRVFKQPGESWLYSGGGYTIMQLAITENDGISFPDTMQKNVLSRLNMTHSTYENPLPNKYHAVAATGYRSNGDEVEGKWPIYPEMAAAGLWTTPSELIQYAIEVQGILQTKRDDILKYESVVEMLTPGMNDHGLGPSVAEYTFGHGGADEGFRARLVAWKDKPYAAVVMVNSDNGRIIQELLLSIANEYDLPGIEQTVREPIELTAGELQKYVGRFRFEDLETCDLELTGDRLILTAELLGDPIWLIPQSTTQFFDSESGMLVDFDVAENDVVSLTMAGYFAERIE